MRSSQTTTDDDDRRNSVAIARPLVRSAKNEPINNILKQIIYDAENTEYRQ